MQFILDNIDPIKIMGHLAYTLILSSFLVKRMLALRSLAIIASVCSILYNANIPGGPIIIPIQWNILFILVNCYHIIMALLESRDVQLNEVEEILYRKNFHSMSKVEFKRLLNCGQSRNYPAHQKLINQDEFLGSVFVLLEGKAQVISKGLHVATLDKGEFIGEMSFLTGTPTKADVILAQDSLLHVWDSETLRSYFAKNPAMMGRFHSAIGNQLISRLLAKSLAEAEGQENIGQSI